MLRYFFRLFFPFLKVCDRHYTAVRNMRIFKMSSLRHVSEQRCELRGQVACATPSLPVRHSNTVQTERP
jgi:hypothetical protein